MSSYSCPSSLPTVLPMHESAATSRQSGVSKDWAMFKQLGWLATTAVLALLVWQTAAAEPLLPRAVSALLLVVVSVLIGLRIGADSAAAYMVDLQRTNKFLAEQQRDLEEMNEMLLKQINSETPTPSEKI
jgi:glucan phosphoethanolaminetransferase (alkaline phosphatase superfamily)